MDQLAGQGPALVEAIQTDHRPVGLHWLVRLQTRRKIAIPFPAIKPLRIDRSQAV